MLRLDSLLYAIEVAKTGSINKAAEKVYLSQPYLSSCLKELEKELGVNLFRRSHKGVEPTEAGTRFLTYANDIQHSLDRMYQLKNEQFSDHQLRILSMHSFTFLDLYYDFERLHKNESCSIRYFEMSNSLIPYKIMNREADLGFYYIFPQDRDEVLRRLQDAGLKFTVLCREQIHAVISSWHPLADRQSVTLEDLASSSLLLEQEKSPLFNLANADWAPLQHCHKHPLSFDNNRSLLYFLTKSDNCFTLGQKCLNLTNPLVESHDLVYLPITDMDNKPILVGYIERAESASAFQQEFGAYAQKVFADYPEKSPFQL